jgi:hypothetical protein
MLLGFIIRHESTAFVQLDIEIVQLRPVDNAEILSFCC